MAATIRQLALDEIHAIASIDTSDTIDAVYECAWNAHGMGLTLRRKRVDPPTQEPKWGKTEFEGRCALWRRNVIEEGAVFHGAFLGDRLVGVSLVTRLSDGRTAELYTLHVDRAHRGQGIGKALLDAAESQCRAWGCDQLLTYTGFKASSLDFYRARGYRVVGVQDPSVKTKNFDVTVVKSLRDTRAKVRSIGVIARISGLTLAVALTLRILWPPGIWILSAVLTLLVYGITAYILLRYYARVKGAAGRRTVVVCLAFSVIPAALLWSEMMTPAVDVISLPTKGTAFVCFDGWIIVAESSELNDLDSTAYSIGAPLQYSLGSQGISVATSAFGRANVVIKGLRLNYTKGIGIKFNDTFVSWRDISPAIPLGARMLVLQRNDKGWQVKQ